MLGAIQILKQDLKLFSNNWKKMMPFLWLLFIPTIVLSFIGLLSAFLVNMYPSVATINGVIMLAIIVATMLFTFWISISLVRYLYDLYQNNSTKTYKEYLSITSSLILPTILISILTGLILVGGLILFIIPGIIFALWYVFANYVMILGHKTKVVNCLTESKRLVSGRWWAIFWRFFVLSIILGLSVIIINLLLGYIVENILNRWPIAITLVISVLSTIVSVIFTPLSVGMSVIIYSEARKTRPEKNTPTAPDSVLQM